MQERENLRMSVPHTAIPMGYSRPPEQGAVVKSQVTRSRSLSEGCKMVAAAPPPLTWTEYLKLLVLKKALLVYITLAEVSFSSLALGRSLRCVKRAVNCYSLVSKLGCPEDASAVAPGVSFALGVAGDVYLACVSRWSEMPVYQEQFNTGLVAETQIAKEVEKYTHELDRDWSIKQPRDIQEAMELAASCYTRALDLLDGGEEATSLQRRLANVENELGVFYMNQATALVQRVSGEEEEEAALHPAMAGAKDLFRTSRKYLERGIARFESIHDHANTALLLSNCGRLSRLAGHSVGLQQEQEQQEYGGEEEQHYRAALDCYRQALAILGSRKVSPDIWDSVTWELSSTLYTVGTLLQDHAPLSSQSREEVEREVTEHMSQALRYMDLEGRGPRQAVFLARAAVIHHRLASLYHHSYRSCAEACQRRKKLRQLSDLHYVKAIGLFQNSDRWPIFPLYISFLIERLPS